VHRRAPPRGGGAAVTEEFHPGFRNSTASYTVSLLDPRVIRDLRLAERGLSIRERPFANFLPLPNGEYLKVGGGIAATQAEVAKFSRRDAEALPAYYAMLDRVAAVLRGMLRVTPPNIGSGTAQDVAALLDLMRTSRKLRTLSLPERRDLVDLFTSAGDVLDRWFTSEPIKAVFGFDAIVGNFASPYTGFRVCVAASRVWRSERPAGAVGSRWAGWVRSRRRWRPARHAASCCGPTRPVARVIVKGRAGRRHRARERRRHRSREGCRQRHAEGCCSSAWSRPSTCPRTFVRASPVIPAAPGPFA
jgi:hypothetical protein